LALLGKLGRVKLGLPYSLFKGLSLTWLLYISPLLFLALRDFTYLSFKLAPKLGKFRNPLGNLNSQLKDYFKVIWGFRVLSFYTSLLPTFLGGVDFHLPF